MNRGEALAAAKEALAARRKFADEQKGNLPVEDLALQPLTDEEKIVLEMLKNGEVELGQALSFLLPDVEE